MIPGSYIYVPKGGFALIEKDKTSPDIVGLASDKFKNSCLTVMISADKKRLAFGHIDKTVSPKVVKNILTWIGESPTCQWVSYKVDEGAHHELRKDILSDLSTEFKDIVIAQNIQAVSIKFGENQPSCSDKLPPNVLHHPQSAQMFAHHHVEAQSMGGIIRSIKKGNDRAEATLDELLNIKELCNIGLVSESDMRLAFIPDKASSVSASEREKIFSDPIIYQIDHWNVVKQFNLSNVTEKYLQKFKIANNVPAYQIYQNLFVKRNPLFCAATILAHYFLSSGEIVAPAKFIKWSFVPLKVDFRFHNLKLQDNVSSASMAESPEKLKELAKELKELQKGEKNGYNKASIIKKGLSQGLKQYILLEDIIKGFFENGPDKYLGLRLAKEARRYVAIGDLLEHIEVVVLAHSYIFNVFTSQATPHLEPTDSKDDTKATSSSPKASKRAGDSATGSNQSHDVSKALPSFRRREKETHPSDKGDAKQSSNSTIAATTTERLPMLSLPATHTNLSLPSTDPTDKSVEKSPVAAPFHPTPACS